MVSSSILIIIKQLNNNNTGTYKWKGHGSGGPLVTDPPATGSNPNLPVRPEHTAGSSRLVGERPEAAASLSGRLVGEAGPCVPGRASALEPRTRLRGAPF